MSSQVTALRPDDRQWYLGFIREALDLTRPDIDTATANRLVMAFLHDHEATTQDIEEQTRARRVLDACAEDGSRRLVYAVVREASTAMRVPNRGIVQMPARVGRRKKGAPGWQQSLWYELTWAEFDEMIVRHTERHTIEATKLFAMRGIRSLRDQYPETTIVGEAIRSAGLDPLDLDLEELDLAS